MSQHQRDSELQKRRIEKAVANTYAFYMIVSACRTGIEFGCQACRWYVDCLSDMLLEQTNSMHALLLEDRHYLCGQCFQQSLCHFNNLTAFCIDFSETHKEHSFTPMITIPLTILTSSYNSIMARQLRHF